MMALIPNDGDAKSQLLLRSIWGTLPKRRLIFVPSDLPLDTQGSVKRMVVPGPSFDSAQSRPSCFSIW
jgi:hypothetical protein